MKSTKKLLIGGLFALFSIFPATAFAAVPTITAILPSQGTANTIVAIFGSNLTGASEVDFYTANNQLAASISNNTVDNISVSPQGTQARFVLSGAFAANVTPGVYQLRVVTPAGTSNGSLFTLTAPSPDIPTLTTVAPNQATANTVVVVGGYKLTGATEIDFYDASNVLLASLDQSNFTVASAGSPLRFVLPATLAYNVNGALQLRVVTFAGRSNALPFTITAPSASAPNITSTNSPVQNAAGSVVTISGTNLTGATEVDFYDSNNQLMAGSNNITVASGGSSLQLTLSGAFAANVLPGTYQIRVVTPQGPSNVVSLTLTSTVVTLPTVTILYPQNNTAYDVVPNPLRWTGSIPMSANAAYFVQMKAVTVIGYSSGDEVFSTTLTSAQAGCSNSDVCSYPLTWSLPGTYTITVKNLQNNASATNTFTINSVSIPGATLTITNPSPLPNAQVGTSYQAILGVTGGPSGISTNQYNWSVTLGKLPAGLYLAASDNGEIIAGTPTVAANETFTLSVKYGAQFGRKDFNLIVNDGRSGTPSITVLSPNGGENILAAGKDVDFRTTWTSSGISGNVTVYLEGTDGNDCYLGKAPVSQGNFEVSLGSNLGLNYQCPNNASKIITTGKYKILLVTSFPQPSSPNMVVQDLSDDYFAINVAPPTSTNPFISYIDPTTARVGDTVAIYGSHLIISARRGSVVKIGSVILDDTSGNLLDPMSNNKLIIRIPSTLTPGTYDLDVENTSSDINTNVAKTVKSNIVPITIVPANSPLCDDARPTHGYHREGMKPYPVCGGRLVKDSSSGDTTVPLPADIDTQKTQGSCLDIQNNLRYRSRDANTNNEVSAFQDFLQTNSYLSSEPTGFFGLMTLKAAKAFQQASGISPTGFIGALSRAKIKALTCSL